NWAAHFYLGWALLENDGEKAGERFRRALEIDERKAVRAYLALARLAHERGQRDQAVQLLETYLALVPEGTDAEAARRLAATLRSPE
ncbi:MAG TPA: tetratricopeptide repeat protein, partial [Pyrinomonadaceae bacterium]|nr:tetratricopeptide repeat protein [Pyrinomonadaceae bacterium]